MPRTKRAKAPAADSEKDGKSKTVATQTSIDDDAIEIARLQEQVRLLKIENEVLRVHTARINIATNKAVNDIPLRPLNSVVEEQISPADDQVKAVAEMAEQIVNPPRSARKGIRGCSCKGNCSTKVCGCVKKDKKCAETCKCSDSLCENKGEPDESNEDKENKENSDKNAVVSKTPQKVADKSRRRRGLFSPNIEDHLFSPSDNKVSSSASSENTLFQSGIRFGQTPLIKSSDSKKEETSSPTDVLDEKSKKIGVRAAVQMESNVLEKEGETDNVVIKNEPPDTPAINKDNAPNVNVVDQDAEVYPFKPKRHLPRTPPQKNKDSAEEALNIPFPEIPSYDSPSSLPDSDLQHTPQPKPLDAKQSAPVSELPESVDWEQHQAQLVSCRKCKRKFMPQRIEKHEACCKKM